MTTPSTPQEDPQPIGESLEQAKARYAAACHAMQSGVAFEMNHPEMHSATEPKHLRVGVNSALSSNGALAKLLIQKGILTEVDLAVAVADAMDEEVEAYENRIRDHLGAAVTLR